MDKFKTILIAGGAGFIGSSFVRHMLENYPDYKIVNYDKLTYAGNLDNLRDMAVNPNYTFVQDDICDAERVDKIISEHGVEALINFAAETHVDRSIHIGSRDFVMTNVVGVQTLLDAARRHNLKKMVNISTDEVYGTLDLNDGRKFYEDTAFTPNVPYAAAKAGGDLMCRAYFKTFKVPVVVSHCSNNYGPYQFPEKLIPFAIFKAMNNEPVPIYGDGLYVRDWIFVTDHCKAIDLMLHGGVSGEVYNIGADNERPNIEVVKMILKMLDKPEDLMVTAQDRPGHDRRYAVDAEKIKNELGWKPEYSADKFEEGLRRTVEWYKNNMGWVEKLQKRQAELNPHIKKA